MNGPRSIVRLVSLAAVAAVLAACSSSGGNPAPSTSASGGTQTYTDPAYGYSFTYDAPFQLEPSAQTELGSGSAALSQVAVVVPPVGPQRPLPSFGINVYALGEAVTQDNLAAAKADLSRHVLGSFANPPASAGNPPVKFGKLTQTTVAGQPTFTAEGTFTYDNAPWMNRLYFVLAGSIEYELVLQGPKSSWQKLEPQMQKMVDSLTVSDSPSGTPSPTPSPVGTYTGANADFCNAVVQLSSAGNTVTLGQANKNDAAVTAGRQSSKDALATLVATLPSDAPATLRTAIQDLQTAVDAAAGGSPSASSSPSPKQNSSMSPQEEADTKASDLIQQYAQKECGP